MSDTQTPNLALEYLDPSQSQPEVKINDAWNKIDSAIGDVGAALEVEQEGDSPGATGVRKIVFHGLTVEPASDGVVHVIGEASSDTSSDSGGGGAISVSFGATTLTGITELELTGSAVASIEKSGTTAIIDLIAEASSDVSSDSGGGGGSANVTPDTHPISPNEVDDEFEYGSSIDTTGARFSGASGWTAFGLSSPIGTDVQASGSLLFAPHITGGKNCTGYSQPISGSTWAYTAKLAYLMNSTSEYSFGGLFVAGSSGASGNLDVFGLSVGPQFITVQRCNNAQTFDSNGYVASRIASPADDTGSTDWYYLQISCDGTNLNFSISKTGLPGSFTQVYTETLSAWVGTAEYVGIFGDNEGFGTQTTLLVDWFRRTA
jgi:hypothetical protein